MRLLSFINKIKKASKEAKLLKTTFKNKNVRNNWFLTERSESAENTQDMRNNSQIWGQGSSAKNMPYTSFIKWVNRDKSKESILTKTNKKEKKSKAIQYVKFNHFL